MVGHGRGRSGIQNQLDSLARKSSRKQAEGIDLDAARDSLSGAVSLWSKAQAAFATGNLPEAVEAAQNVESSLKQIESTLKMHPPAAAGAGRS
jgi:tRNA A-37 threonylcarbamoyl transferase component Bud32